MSKVKKTTSFDEMSEIQKQCIPPYENPIFPVITKNKRIKGKIVATHSRQVPFIQYIKQYSEQPRIDACANETTPYLVWDAENSKYCCGPENLKENDQFVLDKIEDAIRTTVENVCVIEVYEKYITFLIKHYLNIYKRQLSENKELSLEQIDDILFDKQIELNEIAKFEVHEADPSLCDKFPTHFAYYQDKLVDEEVLKAEDKASELNDEAKEQRRGPGYKKIFENEGGFYKKNKKSKKQKISRKSKVSRKRRY
jgi:hypothetical protein